MKIGTVSPLLIDYINFEGYGKYPLEIINED